jgi:hypothetical protein
LDPMLFVLILLELKDFATVKLFHLICGAKFNLIFRSNKMPDEWRQ